MYVPSLLNLAPTHQPILPFQAVTEHWVELPVLHSDFPLAIFLKYGKVYVSMLLFQFIPPHLL